MTEWCRLLMQQTNFDAGIGESGNLASKNRWSIKALGHGGSRRRLSYPAPLPAPAAKSLRALPASRNVVQPSMGREPIER